MKTAIYIEDGTCVPSHHALHLLKYITDFATVCYNKEWLEDVFIHVHQLAPTLFRVMMSPLFGVQKYLPRDVTNRFKNVLGSIHGFKVESSIRHKIRCSSCRCIDVFIRLETEATQ